ncbi:FAD-dependent oxidoreductase [Thermoactinomyces mirandus]|uniref:FAD-dependent oxidoreductase n=1 Tax=Thermoactinomyces mirandus TaxID=2756294 RepID=A0A7W1XU69_9BACL|nr:FAD-dependent oxidoreductase [Thermoactinomyces mirandus]MBA4603372.1 FAD-dependent oxidoreductase [Thermoactinomyces mirandus]
MYEVAVIGAGPAGASAALFTARAGKKTVLLDNGKNIMKKALMLNHYGVEEISGPDMLEKGIAQAKGFGAEFIETEVTALVKTDHGFKIETGNGSVEAKNVIIATGMQTSLGESAGLTTKPGTEPRVKTIFAVNADGKTNVEGLWAAGVCAGVSMHTIITAGDGAKVAVNLISELDGKRYVDHDVLK